MGVGPFSKQDHVEITTLGTEFAVAEILGTGIGFWLDNKWGTTPWLLIAGAVAGFGMGLYIVLKAAKTMQATKKPLQKADEKNGRS